MKKKIGIIVTAASLVCVLTIPMSASAATVKTLSWNLVDSGKHMDWDGSTKYQTQLNAGVKTLNGYKSGVIRKDTAKVIQDVAISDYSEKSSVAGVTSSRGTIKFNKYVMDTLTATKKQNVATHELGHALGLAHNTSSDVMYEYVSTKTSLSANDKASYAAAYKKY
ncbi:M57 family metalloprotease [Peribacillus muralis]|uniref:matrixin family metalloprotease n=1 Tax=Peribacillus muralis TaxID=264697 RepID=UPI001F4E425C|nr:M57 family metalloprotease [Peribacillus muralis]MCK1992180.1 M57 family metalloprotease [Peribacillus muralis]MCK2012736.1 M57 family metalloprotease [Peribacillus muralis]